ncbi:MAG: molecular chaperone GrpE [Cryomorphaceae bacterium]|jgi:molecular chaperone GrpE
MNREDIPDLNSKNEPTAHETEADLLKSQESTEGFTGTVEGVADIDSEQVASDDAVDEASELESAQAEIAKLKDAFLRAKAEQDNVRRRAEKDIANSRKFAVEGFAKELLSVFDSLKLATAVELAEDPSDTVKSVREGVEITLKQVNSAFAKFAVKEIAPQVGDKLDPNLHQAMTMVDSEEIESGCIITVIQAGFELHQRLLRPAMVVVAK